MPSEYEDTAVESLDFGSLSKEELKDIAENDTRVTAQDKARAELNRQEDQTTTSVGTAAGPSDDPRLSPSVQEQIQPADPAERQVALGFDTEGIDTEGDGGVAQLQEAQDAIDQKGFIGAVPDPTPNENYAAQNSTVENNLPTPETDAELFDVARAASVGHPLRNVERSSVETAVRGDK